MQPICIQILTAIKKGHAMAWPEAWISNETLLEKWMKRSRRAELYAAVWPQSTAGGGWRVSFDYPLQEMDQTVASIDSLSG